MDTMILISLILYLVSIIGLMLVTWREKKSETFHYKTALFSMIGLISAAILMVIGAANSGMIA